MSDTPTNSDQQPAAPAPKSNKKMLMMIVLFVVVLTAVVSAIMIPGLNKKTTTKIANVAGPPVKVSIAADGFTPASLTLTLGTTVTWTNTDTNPHRVASDPYPTNDGLPGFDSTEALQTNDHYSYTFNKVGTFTYHDQQNPYDLKGTVTVSPAAQN